MIKCLTVVGARPQFIKASALSRAITTKFSHKIQELILHTGQHYDDRMSQVFFNDLGIPDPAYNLGVGSAMHGAQTAEMIRKIEEVIVLEKPDVVVVYGDTNSTLAGALAASKLHIPVAHIEAGLRSFNKAMPEEINRIVTDHVSTFLFSPTDTGIQNLIKEGFKKEINISFNIDNPLLVHSGDLMYDNALYFAQKAEMESGVPEFKKDQFILLTLHRESNTNDPEILSGILKTLAEISRKENMQIVWPVHPRTRKVMKEQGLSYNDILPIEPASYFEMLKLESDCNMVITDSGGVQKEAYFHHKKCLVLRDQTEWVELAKHGAVEVAGITPEGILDHYEILKTRVLKEFPAFYGDGQAAAGICEVLTRHLG